jgi:hypothetical protein
MFGRKRRAKPVAAVAVECFFCRRHVAYGEPYVSLNYHLEQT